MNEIGKRAVCAQTIHHFVSIVERREFSGVEIPIRQSFAGFNAIINLLVLGNKLRAIFQIKIQININ